MDDVRFMKKGGMYLLVLHPATATVMHVSRHRTFERSGDHELRRVVEGVQPGRILVLAALVRSKTSPSCKHLKTGSEYDGNYESYSYLHRNTVLGYSKSHGAYLCIQ